VVLDFTKYLAVQENLREISLSRNCIKEIPEEFLFLNNLSILRLDHNQIEIIPPRFGDSFYNLSELWLNHNQITEVPWTFSCMRQLRILHLNHNKISYLPNTFGELDLDELSIHHNPLPDEICSMPTLEDTIDAILCQNIPKQYRKQIKTMVQDWESKNRGKTEGEVQFVFFLQQADWRLAFRSYLEKEFSQENLDFWWRVEQLKWRYNSVCPIRSQELIKEALDIYRDFIPESAPHAINIPSDIRDTLKSIFEDSFRFPNGINQWTFDDAYENILKLMFSDTFSRYQLTPEGSVDFDKAVLLLTELPIHRFKKLASSK
jgi:hypothetical protein